MKKELKDNLQDWKAKYGQLFHIVVPIDDKKTAEFIVRKPSKPELTAMTSKENTSDFNELMFNSMIVAGDRQYIDDTPEFMPDVYLTMVQELGKLYQPKEATSVSL